jgi:xeroderma pigmentosum group C-complementing protein
MESESWENDSSCNSKSKKTKMQKMKTLHQILFIIQLLKKRRIIQISQEINEHEKLRELQNKKEGLKTEIFPGLFNRTETTQFCAEQSSLSDNINLFCALNRSGVLCKIYFIIKNSSVESFIEYMANGKVVESKKLYDGNIFSVDILGNIEDCTVVFSKNHKNYKIFSKIISVIRKTIYIAEGNLPWTDDRIKKIPNSIGKLKIHPLYCAECICNSTQFIYPKRPVVGYLKGEAVLLRANLKQLKTEKSYYRMGLYIKAGQKPYRVISDKKLFADFQTEKFAIKNINGKVMDYFCDTFIPEGCCYIDYSSEVCRILQIKFSDCLVGFNYKDRIIRGFFIEKKHAYIVNQAIKEISYYKSMQDYTEKYERVMQGWNLLISKARAYKKIKERLDMRD